MCVDIRYNLNMHKRFLDSIPDITNSVSQNLNILKISIKKIWSTLDNFCNKYLFENVVIFYLEKKIVKIYASQVYSL